MNLNLLGRLGLRDVSAETRAETRGAETRGAET
jgi:hypothetical protein